MGFTSLFKTRDTSSPSYSSSSWAWPSCKHPKTNSFRAGGGHDDIYKTVSSVFFDTTESWFTNSYESDESETFPAAAVAVEEEDSTGESLEAVVRGLRDSDHRLLFEPGGGTSSILEEAESKAAAAVATGGGYTFFEESVVLAMESEDPYSDFRVSMEEMVVAHGLCESWERLEGLLEWYLRANGKKTHGFIVGAFVDLLLDLASVSSPPSSPSSCSFPFGVEEGEMGLVR